MNFKYVYPAQVTTIQQTGYHQDSDDAQRIILTQDVDGIKQVEYITGDLFTKVNCILTSLSIYSTSPPMTQWHVVVTALKYYCTQKFCLLHATALWY